jgi:tRNA threonylcarbamoyladenosine biosynthesis protein TsaB
MLILAIESSEPRASLALMRSGALLDEAQSEPRRAHGGRLMVEVDAILRNNGVAVGDVTVFAASAGPGSFTGIRVGLSTVRALAWSIHSAVTAFSTLRVLAMSLKTDCTWVCPTLDARKGEVYGALYRLQQGECVEVVRPAAMAPVDWHALVLREVDGPVHFVGSGTVRYDDVFCCAPHHASDYPPQASALAHLVHQHVVSHGIDSLPAAIPSYVRPSEAEVKFGKAPAYDPAAQIRETP